MIGTKNNSRRHPIFLALIALLICACPSAGRAITPDQVLLVVNTAEPEGVRIAEYYMQKRGIPSQNIVRIETTLREQIEREDYERQIAAPVRRFLTGVDPKGHRFKCLLLIYGIPLRIESPPMTAEGEKRVLKLKELLSQVKEKLKSVDKVHPETQKDLNKEIERVQKEIIHLDKSWQGASVDSELALVREEKYPLEGWLLNRYFILFRKKDTSAMPQNAIAVSRLDGPSARVVYRIIDDSLSAEKEGLTGKAYFDARWPYNNGKNLNAYEMYDRSIHHTARIVEKIGKLKVVLDKREALFQPGEAPDAALYCGWYSLGKYVDAFTWKKGAVGFHVASSECTTLKTPASTVWCKVMLEKGIAATVGPVAEPYLKAFPLPEAFFGCLLDGLTLVDCYTISNPFWSWQMILVGDPLYRPFKFRSARQESTRVGLDNKTR